METIKAQWYQDVMYSAQMYTNDSINSIVLKQWLKSNSELCDTASLTEPTFCRACLTTHNLLEAAR